MTVLEMSSRHGMIRRGEKSAVAAVCYITGSYGVDERTGQSFNYESKGHVGDVEVMLPEGAPSWMNDPQKMMMAAELYEDVWAERRFKTPLFQERHKATAFVAHTAHYSLHHGLREDPEAMKEVIRTFVEDRYLAYGVGIVVAIHDEAHNLHFHVQATKREVVDDLEGFGRKAACFESPAVMSGWAKENRATLARLQNEALRDLEHEGVVEHRTLEERGVDLEATLHQGELGIAFDDRGERGRVSLENESIQAQNREKVLSDPGIILRYMSASRATFTEKNIFYEVSRRVNEDEVGALMKDVMDHPDLVALPRSGDEPTRYTTKSYERDEAEMFRLGALMHGEEREGHQIKALETEGLNEGQQEAAWACVSSSRMVLLRGAAGVGKTTLLRPVARALEDQGYRIQGLALAGVAVEGLKRSLGCESRTIASFLLREERIASGEAQRSSFDLGSRDVVILDEAGMVDVPTMSKVLKVIHERGAMVRLVGDPEQLKAIGAGDAFRGLWETLGGVSLDEVVRQRDKTDREAVTLMSRGHMDQGLGLLKDRVQFYDTEEKTLEGMVDAFVESTHPVYDQNRGHDSGVMLAFRKRDVKALNEKTRERLRDQGALQHERTLLDDKEHRSLGEGDRILFLEKNRDMCVINGTRGVVTGFDDIQVYVRTDEGREVSFEAASYHAWDYGYAMTVHKSQGITTDRVWMKADPMLGSEGHYVGLSRHRDHVTLIASRETFRDYEDLERTLEKGGKKDLIKDWKHEGLSDETLLRYQDVRQESRLSDEAKHELKKESQELAASLVKSWGDVSSKARLQGVRLSRLEQESGTRTRELSSKETASEHQVLLYKGYAQEARDLWGTIRKTHPGRQCYGHPDYGVFCQIREKRDSIAYHIQSSPEDHRGMISYHRVSKRSLASQAQSHDQRQEKIQHQTLGKTMDPYVSKDREAPKSQVDPKEHTPHEALKHDDDTQMHPQLKTEGVAKDLLHVETRLFAESMVKGMEKEGEAFSKSEALDCLQTARVQSRMPLEDMAEGKEVNMVSSQKEAVSHVMETQEYLQKFQKELESRGYAEDLVDEGGQALLGHLQRYGHEPTEVQKEHIIRFVERVQPLKEHMEVPQGLEETKDIVWHYCVDRMVVSSRDGMTRSQEALKGDIKSLSKDLQDHMHHAEKHQSKSLDQVQKTQDPAQGRGGDPSKAQDQHHLTEHPSSQEGHHKPIHDQHSQRSAAQDYRALNPAPDHQKKMRSFEDIRFIHRVLDGYDKKSVDMWGSMAQSRVESRLYGESLHKNQFFDHKKALSQASLETRHLQDKTHQMQESLMEKGMNKDLAQDASHHLLSHEQRYGQKPTEAQKEWIVGMVQGVHEMKHEMNLPEILKDRREEVFHHVTDHIIREGQGRTLATLRDKDALKSYFNSRATQLERRFREIHKERHEERTQEMERSLSRGRGLEM